MATNPVGGTRFELDITQIYLRQLQIRGLNGGTMHDLMSALALVEAGYINPVIDTVLPLDEIHEGHRILEAGEDFGKAVSSFHN